MQKIIHINVESGDSATDKMIQGIMGINEFMQSKVKQDIYLAFEHAQKEIDYLHTRTREGIAVAREDGKQMGGVYGKKLITRKSIEKKAEMRKHLIDFGGTLTDYSHGQARGVLITKCCS